MFEVSVQQTFAAAHALRGYKGKCENLHGHNYRVEVTVEGEALNNIGLLADFVDIKRALKVLIDRLDHTNLNETAPFDVRNPSAENIAQYLATDLKTGLDEGVRIARVTVWETDTSVAVYRP